MIVTMRNSAGAMRTVKTGFSWTTLFFGFLVPIFRGDAKWAVIMFFAAIFTFYLAIIVLAFTYNGTFIRGLMEKGYYASDAYSENALRAKGFIV